MFDVVLSNDYLADINGTSEGTQDKYYKDGYWYKVNRMGDEATAEVLSSILLSCSSLDPKEYVMYEDGTINYLRGCRSKDFLKSGDTLITLYRLYQYLTGNRINEVVFRLGTPQERADYVVDFFLKNINLDLSDYFSKIFTLDLFNLNEDRHFNNLAVVRKENGVYVPAPIFDNGKSLFIGNYSINNRLTFAENRVRVSAKPFSYSPNAQYELFKEGFKIDFDLYYDVLKGLSPHIIKSKELDILLKNVDYVLQKYPELSFSKGCIDLLEDR